jgi:RecB family exonuclease
MSDSFDIPYHLQQLAHLCEQRPLARKVIFVPRRRIGHKLSAALVQAGRSWANLHLTTPYEWAKRQVEPRLRSEGWKELTAGADLLVIEALVRASDLEIDLEPETLARTAAATVPALRLAGVDPEEVWKADGPDALKQLVETLGLQYAAYLHREKLYDEAEVFERALDRLPEMSRTDGICGIFDEVELPGLVFQFVRAVADRSPQPLQRIGRDGYGTVLPELAAGRRFSMAPVPVSRNGGRTVGAGGSLWNEVPDPESTGILETEQVLGTANEIRSVLRKLHREEIPYDQVELVYTAESDYLQRIYSVFSRYDIPATFSGGLPVAVTRPGRALRLFYDWIETGFGPTVLVELFASGSLATIDGLDPKKAATVIRKARPARGEDQYFAALGRLERAYREDETDRKDDLRTVEAVRSLLQRLFALVPDRQTTVEDLARCTGKFLDVFADRRDHVVVYGAAEDDGAVSIDREAVETLVTRFTSLTELIHGEQPRSRLVRQFKEQLSRHKMADSSPRPACLHVSDLQSAGYTNRPHVFVIGLNQSAFPGGRSEDPLLLDHMRRKISAELPIRGNTPAEMNWHLARVLGMSTGRAALICSRRSLVDDRPLHPSPAFLRAEKLAGTGPASLTLLPEPPAGARVDEEWLARTLLTESELGMILRETPTWHEIANARYPWLANGRRAMTERASERLTRYDGVLSVPDDSLALNGRTVSASRLETLMTCTYRYFMKYVLNVEPVEELTERDSDRWLDPRDFGSLLHRLFRRFMHRLAERGETVDREHHEPFMEQLLAEEVDRQAEQLPPPNAAARRRDVDRLRTCARIFLAAEEQYGRDHTPAGFEVSFGRREPSHETLGQSDPVPMRLSDEVQFRLQGTIDRIDRGPNGAYTIWDYKTGSTYEFEEYDLFSGGKKLQWALYAHALAEITDEPVNRSGYFFPTAKTYGQRMTQEMPGSEEINHFLEPLFKMVERGYFLQAASEDHCQYCDYREICGDYDQRESEVKKKLNSETLTSDQKELLQQWNYYE